MYMDRHLARRTGVIFYVFQANRGESEANAKRELRARGGALKIAYVPLKYAKNYACSAG